VSVFQPIQAALSKQSPNSVEALDQIAIAIRQLLLRKPQRH
jgi:hypothetical protein